MTSFKPGHTYKARIVSTGCSASVAVEKRTAKTLTTTEGQRLRVRVWDGVEFVEPWGRGTLNPIVWAGESEK